MIEPNADIVVIGMGAAGFMASIHAARAGARVIGVDGAKRLGAKILVAGGGRCNVTHERVSEADYAGSTAPAIRNVLRQFDVGPTIAFFRDLGVELKREETGKLFPVTDKAGTVLDALHRGAGRAGVEVRHPWRVGSIVRTDAGLVIQREGGDASPNMPGELRASRVILATGGKSLPKTGSDGAGYAMAQSLGHTLTPSLFPGLVPLLLPRGHALLELAGITTDATLVLRDARGRSLRSFTGSTLITHVGLSGPSVLNMSRFWTQATLDAPNAPPTLHVNWLNIPPAPIDESLQRLGRTSLLRFLGERLPERLARFLCDQARVDPGSPGHALTREDRKALVALLTECPLPIEGDRGYLFAEVTAGGVPLSQVHLTTMESRVCPGLHLCGEICDVDGRIGGLNFQWAWASGFVAGTGAARALHEATGDQGGS